MRTVSSKMTEQLVLSVVKAQCCLRERTGTFVVYMLQMVRLGVSAWSNNVHHVNYHTFDTMFNTKSSTLTSLYTLCAKCIK
jgi:hypothetical protein